MRARRRKKRRRETVSAYKACPDLGVHWHKKAGRVSRYVCMFCCLCSSESEGIDHPHYHYVSDGGDDGNPEPDGVAGHGLRLVLLALRGGRRRGGVDVGRGVEERVFATVVVVRRGVHEGPRHHRDLRSNDFDSWSKLVNHLNSNKIFIKVSSRLILQIILWFDWQRRYSISKNTAGPLLTGGCKVAAVTFMWDDTTVLLEDVPTLAETTKSKSVCCNKNK